MENTVDKGGPCCSRRVSAATRGGGGGFEDLAENRASLPIDKNLSLNLSRRV